MKEKTERSSSAAAHLIIAAAVVIAGAIFRNSHISAGHWLTIAGIGYYLLMNARSAWNAVRRFFSLEPRGKAHLLIVAVMLFLFVRSFFTTDIPYFIILVLLAIEYLLVEPAKNK